MFIASAPIVLKLNIQNIKRIEIQPRLMGRFKNGNELKYYIFCV